MRSSSTTYIALSLFLLTISTAQAEAPGTLVVQEGDAFRPGAATSWSGKGTEITFVLADGVDAEEVKATLSDRLANATVEIVDGKIKITGIPKDTLLGQLSIISVSGEAIDPLAALTGLGGAAVAMEQPEGGGSIRASRPMDGMPPMTDDDPKKKTTKHAKKVANLEARSIAQHDPGERCDAVVLEVERASFPSVTLKLKVKSSAKKGPLKKKLKYGKVFDAAVVLESGASGIDFNKPATQRNLGAYYLEKGDKITVHAIPGKDDAIELDWVERKKKR